MLSIDDDDGTTEYDPHEHAESLRHGIPDQFGRGQCCPVLWWHNLCDILKQIDD